MDRFWKWVKQRHGTHAVDATSVGHGSGTGLVQFCGDASIDD
eukprot:gene51059-45837_t